MSAMGANTLSRQFQPFVREVKEKVDSHSVCAISERGSTFPTTVGSKYAPFRNECLNGLPPVSIMAPCILAVSKTLFKWANLLSDTMEPQSTVGMTPSVGLRRADPSRISAARWVNMCKTSSYWEEWTMTRSIPIQFWPAFWLVYCKSIYNDYKDKWTHNTPRKRILEYFSMSVDGIKMAGSFPPNSSVTGVRCSVAAWTTWNGISNTVIDPWTLNSPCVRLLQNR